MRVKRIDEADFRKRPFGVLDDYLFGNHKHTLERQRFIKNLSADECLVLVSKNGMNVIFVRGFDQMTTEAGTTCRALGFYQMQLDHKWSLPLLQTFARDGKLPFQITNFKAFEEVFPKIAEGAKVFVKKAS